MCLRRLKISTVIGLAGLSLATAHAHEEEELEEIVVKGRWDTPNGLLVSASQGIISQADIDVRPRLRPGDLLEVVPGLIVTQHSGSGKSNQMFLRGFNLDHGTDFASWIDGMPINMPSHGHGQGYTDLNFIIPELVDRLEFRKGPYYTDVSDFSSAGAAFFSTASELKNGMIKAGIGQDGHGQLLVADSFKTDSGVLLAGIQTQLYDGPWVGVSEDLRKNNALLRYTNSEPEVGEWNITFMGYDARWNAADQVPLRAVRDGRVPFLGTIDDSVGGDTSRYSLSGRWHRDFGSQQVTARAYAIDYELRLFSNFTYFLEDPINGDQIEQVDDRQVYGGDFIWRWSPDNAQSHEAGVAIRYDDIDSVGLYRTARRARIGVVRADSIGQFSGGLHYDYAREWNSRWRSTIGARADYFHFDIRQSSDTANLGSHAEWQFSPKLNVIRTLSDNTEAYFSAGLAFHSNDARGVVRNTSSQPGAQQSPVDGLVQSNGAEIGIRYFDEERLNVSAALWVLELDSELLFVGDAGNTEASGRSRRYGIEVPIYYRVSDQLIFDLELSLSRSGFKGAGVDGDEIPGSLERVIAAGVSKSFDNGMYANLRFRHFGDRPLIESGEVRSDDSTVANLGVGYRMERFDFRIEALNVLDADADDITYFYRSRLPGEPQGGFEDIHFHPIEPRTFRAFLTWYN